MAGTAMKVDLKRQLGKLYSAHAEPALVEVPSMRFLMIDGHGDPNGSTTFREAVQSLYAVSYGLKFRVRGMDHGIEYGVMPLEGLWWAPDMRVFEVSDRAAWEWTMMIRQPSTVTADLVQRVTAEVGAKKQLPALALVRFGALTEGRAAQVLHVGPYPAEGPTIARLHAFVAEQGLHLAGKHHEIYLGDPRRAAPERLRTIIRQPVTA